jgi:hypothetical protein
LLAHPVERRLAGPSLNARPSSTGDLSMTIRQHRRALVAVPLVAAALWAVVWGAAPASDPPAKPTPAPEPPLNRLFKPQAFRGIDDPETQLGEALTFIGAGYGVKIDLNEEAFREEQLDNVEKRPIGELPAMASASLDRVLRKLLARLPVPDGAGYMVRGDHLQITTRHAQIAEVWGRFQGPYLPLVHADIEGRPLTDALQGIAEQANMSVVVDARAADKAKTAVTASFVNLPLDTAVRILADMAGLKSALNDNNVIYVSTEERNVAARASGESAGAVLTASGRLLNPAQSALFAAVQTASFDKRPLQEVLQELLKPTDMKLVVDAVRVGDKAKTAVTANLEGSTTEAAIRLLADMADLRPVIYDNVVYLTTKENANGFIKANKSDGTIVPSAGLGGIAGINGGALGALGLGGGFGGLGGALGALGGGPPASPR